ncbi:MAG TPA: hypothetical protein VKY26_07765, partial [Actinomycetota bacterium]|nr:hypothetical protein [Actinomycetota bacterium]
ATVSVSSSSAPLTPPSAPTPPKPTHTITPSLLTLSVTALTIHLDTAKPTLHLHVKVTGSRVLTIILLDTKNHVLTRWTEHLKSNSSLLSLLLPGKDRHKGHYKVRVTQSGNSKTKQLSLALIA